MNFTLGATETIYKIMMLPIVLNCSNICIGVSDSLKSKLENPRDPALRVDNWRIGTFSFACIDYINTNCVLLKYLSPK